MTNSNKKKKKSSVLSESIALKEFESIKKPLMTDIYEDVNGNGLNFICEVFTSFAWFVGEFIENPILGPFKANVEQLRLANKFIKKGYYKNNFLDVENLSKKENDIYYSMEYPEEICYMADSKCEPDVQYYRIDCFQEGRGVYCKTKEEARQELFRYVIAFGGCTPWIDSVGDLSIYYKMFCDQKKLVMPLQKDEERKWIELMPEQCKLLFNIACLTRDYQLKHQIAYAKKRGKLFDIPLSIYEIRDAISSSADALEFKSKDSQLLEVAKLQKHIQSQYRLNWEII